MKDFTIDQYIKLINALVDLGFTFLTFREWIERKNVSPRTVILRHDIDKKIDNALVVAEIEKNLNVKSTFYIRMNRRLFRPKKIMNIANFSHEVGYHYTDFVDSHGNSDVAINLFRDNLGKLRKVVPISTIAMDGSPLSRYDNRELWNHYNYRDFDIIGEPYFDFITADVNNLEGDRFYFTDTGGMWDGDKYNVRDKAVKSSSAVNKVKVHSTDDLIQFLITHQNVKEVMINTHPQRWTDNKIEWLSEFLTQKAKNIVKQMIVKRSQK